MDRWLQNSSEHKPLYSGTIDVATWTNSKEAYKTSSGDKVHWIIIILYRNKHGDDR